MLLLQALYPGWHQVCLVVGGCGLLYFSESETSRRAYALDSVTNARVQPAMMTLASYQWLQFRSDCTLPPLKVFCTRMYNRYNCSPYLHLCAAADSVLLHPTEVWVAEKYGSSSQCCPPSCNLVSSHIQSNHIWPVAMF